MDAELDQEATKRKEKENKRQNVNQRAGTFGDRQATITQQKQTN